MTLRFEQQQQAPVDNLDAPDPNEAGVNAGDNSGQDSFQRVTAEEAATLPYHELKRRMQEERRLYDEGLLDAQTPGQESDDENPDNAADDDEPNAGQDTTGRGQGSGGKAGGTGQQGDPELQRLLQAAQERNAALERAAAEEKQRTEAANLQAQHQRIEQAIASLPDQQQQELARQDYRNRLGHRALTDYNNFLDSRAQQLQMAEIRHARREIPEMLGEVADSVAQRHGLRDAAPLKDYVASAEFRELLEAAETPQALQLAAANAGQWMEFLAVRQAAQNAAAREARRAKAAANPRIVRDTPGGGVPTAGGDMDLVRRIQTMSKEDFFKWKKDQLRAAANA